MQHVRIKPMVVLRDDLEARRSIDLAALRLVATLVMLWLCVAIYAALENFDRLADLAARV